MILPEEHHAKWLGEAEDGDLKELLKPFPSEWMKIWPISLRVNDPDNTLTPSLVDLHGTDRGSAKLHLR
jgi:putative SOS response-associated peptidase YedK